MKKYIIIIGFIMISLTILVLNWNDIYRIYRINQMKYNLINELNGKFNKSTSKNTINDYILYHTSVEELNNYNITILIEKYLDIADNSVMNIKEKRFNDSIGWSENINNPSNLKKGVDILMRYDTKLCIEEELNEIDVINYNKGVFRTLLINELKKILYHEEKDGIIEWRINSIHDMEIELPYGCYISYKAYHREENVEFKKVVDIEFRNDYELQKNFERVVINYETNDGEIKKVISNIYYNNKDGEDHYRIPLNNGLLIKGVDTMAQAELKSHIADRLIEERYKEINSIIFENWDD